MNCLSKNQTLLSDLVARSLFIVCQMVGMLEDRILEKMEWRLDTNMRRLTVPKGM
jgi:hypothetical protein